MCCIDLSALRALQKIRNADGRSAEIDPDPFEVHEFKRLRIEARRRMAAAVAAVVMKPLRAMWGAVAGHRRSVVGDRGI